MTVRSVFRRNGANVRLELINTLYRQSPPIFIGNFAVVSLSIYLLWDHVTHGALLGWAAAIYVVTAVRIAMVWRDRRTSAHTVETISYRGWRYALFSGVSGCLWGSMGILFFAPDNTVVTAFICIVLAGMTGGSVASLSCYWPAYVAYAVPTVLPFSLRSFVHGSPLFSVLGLLSLFLLAVNLAYSRTMQRTVREAVSLRFENIELIQQLTEEKQREALANRSKSQFLAAASHDLRQPVHALGLYIATLRVMAQAPSIEGAAVNSLVDRLQTALKGMSQLLNVLLDISRLDAGVIDVVPRRFALQQALDTIENQFSQPALAKGLKLKIRPTSIWLETDAVLLHNILSNLLSNALRYTVKGTILVACRPRNGEVEIQVFDTGIGIHSEQFSSIFREFYQVDNAARDRAQGLGLGLAIVKRTATLLGARIQLRSSPGHGSLFSILLPARLVIKPPKIIPDASHEEPLVKHRPKTILIVDDDQDVLASMKSLLNAWGHTVVTAASLEKAIAAAIPCQDKLELILSDFRLAKHVTGVDAIHAVFRSIGREMPAIIITGDTSPDGINAASSSGFQVLHKPLDPQKLQELIDA